MALYQLVPAVMARVQSGTLFLKPYQKQIKLKVNILSLIQKLLQKKDELYGKLDNTTMEWTDIIFTGILRKITENVQYESQRNHWIIFDGDKDPE